MGQQAKRVRQQPDREWLRFIALAAVAVMLFGVVLSPVLRSGFLGDDEMSSANFGRSSLQYTGQTLIGRFASENLNTIRQVGRLFPLSALTMIPLYLADGNPAGYKVYVLAMLLLNAVLFGFLVLKASKSRSLTLISLAVLPLLFQIHSARYHDPIVGFAALLQIETACIFLSLIAYLIYLESDKKWALWTALGVFVATLLMYEITIVFPLLYLIVAWLHDREGLKRALRRSWPFFAAAGAMVIAILALRFYQGTALTSSGSQFSQGIASGSDPSAGAYGMSLSPIPVAETFLKQMLATLPLIYWWSSSQLGGLKHAFAQHVGWNLLLLSGYALLGWQLYRALSSRSEKGAAEAGRSSRVLPLGLALALLTLPNVLISLSPRYQSEVFLGVGYLPSYMACYGTALLLGLLALWALEHVGKRSTALIALVVVLACFGTIVGTLNLHNNGVEVEYTNRPEWYPRELLGTAVERGLFADLPMGSTIVVEKPKSWDALPFYAGLSRGKTQYVYSLEGWLEQYGQAQQAPPNTYYLTYSTNWKANGMALLSEVVGVDSVNAEVLLRRPMLFVQSTPSNTLVPLAGSGFAEPVPSAAGLDDSQFERVSSEGDWSLMRGAPSSTLAVTTTR